jgi:2'-5' RNA ligase
MSAPIRWAVYLAPPPESALWRFGSDVIGRDAAHGGARPDFAPAGFAAAEWRALTAEPRRYGFHATLKAPFRLADGASRTALGEAIASLAREFTPFPVGPLAMSTLALDATQAFVALTPSAPSPALAALEDRTVRDLDSFRAPLSEAERARRDPSRLTERQRETFARWGYPYALADFRLHFTLTNALAEAPTIAASLAQEFIRRVADPAFIVDALVLFAQQSDGEFVVDERFALGG